MGTRRTPADRQAALDKDRRRLTPPIRRRHCWILIDGDQHPALLIRWRRTPDGWEGLVVTVHDREPATAWVPAAQLRPA